MKLICLVLAIVCFLIAASLPGTYASIRATLLYVGLAAFAGSFWAF
jgi:hypothetical protein